PSWCSSSRSASEWAVPECASRPKRWAEVAEDVVHESNFQRLTRLGFFARGFLYVLIAALVILTGKTEDLTGALEYVGRGVGKALLVVLTVGMAGYGLWRLADALV